MRILPVLTVTLALCGCRHTQVIDSAGEFNPYGPLDPKTKVLGLGKYKALDFGNNLVVYATGLHRTSHWKTDLEVENRGDGTTVLALYGEPPAVSQATLQAFTPFRVSKVLRPEHGKTIRIRDASGVHNVPIEALDELMSED
jgi:hypothetical protein